MTVRAFAMKLACAFVLLSSLAPPAPASAGASAGAAPSMAASPATAQARTPPKGSPDRKAILAALRGVAKRMSGLDVVFVVRHLKVNGNWAWVVAEPRSADGSQHYETMSGLLTWKSGRWTFLEGPPEWPVCEADPECVDPARYFDALAKKHPGLPRDIFPR